MRKHHALQKTRRRPAWGRGGGCWWVRRGAPNAEHYLGFEPKRAASNAAKAPRKPD